MNTDTVEHAASTPDHPQPYRELGLKDDEYQRIRQILGRRPPTPSSRCIRSWSEHCSYKSSKVHLRYFGETTTDEMRAAMLPGIGENAGVVDIGDGWAVTFRSNRIITRPMSSPTGARATGVGGIVRDIMAMGARPVAVMDPAEVRAADAPDTRRWSTVSFAASVGTEIRWGCPTSAGNVFDASYAGNPLVNAMCVGVLRKEDLPGFRVGHRKQDHPVRARTGLDGIGGVSVPGERHLRRQSGAGRKKLPSVQVGDPFMGRCSSSAVWNSMPVAWWWAFRTGGAGLSCATSRIGVGWRRREDRTRQGPQRRRQHDAGRGAVQRIAGADV